MWCLRWRYLEGLSLCIFTQKKTWTHVCNVVFEVEVCNGIKFYALYHGLWNHSFFLEGLWNHSFLLEGLKKVIFWCKLTNENIFTSDVSLYNNIGRQLYKKSTISIDNKMFKKIESEQLGFLLFWELGLYIALYRHITYDLELN